MTNRYLTKIAQLSSDTKKEISQTGVMAAAGAATGYIGHKTMETGVMRGIKIPAAGKAALAVGGIGLLGDYAAVKLNRHIEKKAHMVENRYLQKVANTYDSNTLAPLGKIDIGHAKDVTPTHAGSRRYRAGQGKMGVNIDYIPRRTITTHSGRAKALSALAIAGLGTAGYLAHKSIKKPSMDKQAGLVLNSLKRGVQRLGGQLKTLGQDFATAPKTMAGMKSMTPSITPILKNRAVQAGAGVVGAGIIGKSMISSGRQKQASISGVNIYLDKVAGQFTEEQAEAMSRPKNMMLTGVFAHRKAINEAGGKASVIDLANRNQMARYTKDAIKSDLKTHLKAGGGSAAGGAILGALLSKSDRFTGAIRGGIVGTLVGTGGASIYNTLKKDWGERIPAQVKEDILAGKYDKK